jgi:hypothetical protein
VAEEELIQDLLSPVFASVVVPIARGSRKHLEFENIAFGVKDHGNVGFFRSRARIRHSKDAKTLPDPGIRCSVFCSNPVRVFSLPDSFCEISLADRDFQLGLLNF